MSIFKSIVKLLTKSKSKQTKKEFKDNKQYVNAFKEPDQAVSTSKKENYKGKEIIKYDEWVSNANETNQNGTSRQEILSKCNLGDVVSFKLFETSDDYYYLEVWTNQGCIGCIHNFDTLQTVARYIKNGGVIHNAKISFIKYPKTNKGTISCKVYFERNKMR